MTPTIPLVQTEVSLTQFLAYQVYNTAEEYAKVFGVPVPTFDPTRPIKRWFMALVAGASRMVNCGPALAINSDTNELLINDAGEYYLELLYVPKEEVVRVNIQPAAAIAGPQPVYPETPCPLVRDLYPEEILTKGMMGAMVVRNRSYQASATTPTSFSQTDRDAIQQILAWTKLQKAG